MTHDGKKVESQEEPDGGEPVPPADHQGAGAASAATSNPDKLEELTTLVKSLIRSHASRDQQVEKESTRPEQRC